MSGFFADMLANALGEVLADLFGETLQQRADRRALQRGLAEAVVRAEQQVATTYADHDPELVQALLYQTRFSDLPSVRAALRDLLARPFHDPHEAVAVLRRSFTDVLPERIERTRVDAVMAAFLAALGREVLYIPQLRDLYALSFQKLSAESSRATAEHTAATARQLAVLNAGLGELQESLRLLAATPPAPLLLNAPSPQERPRPWHNLPQRSYSVFIGRQTELEQIARLLLPHPRSRHFVVTIDGIGGIGKSALALEVAYGYCTHFHAIPEAERFAAVIWVSAKRTLLTASGIQPRRQSFTTLDDLFREVATVLEQPAILQAPLHERRSLVEHALSAQRTLLIVDNLETVDDEELLSFLRELPDPTKALITTRHRIDIAYAMRLSGMPRADALRLMQVESAAKGVTLSAAEMDELERRTGGVPLAIQWSIALMSMGLSVAAVLRRLGQGQSDIARFCFTESVARIRGRDAYRLLLALALFERSVNRTMLGAVACLADDPIGHDDGLAELLQLSLVNQKGDRFSLLPLTHAFARDERLATPALDRELRDRWIACLLQLAAPFNVVHWQQPDRSLLRREGEHLVSFALWAEAQERPELLLKITSALSGYYDAVGRWRDKIALYQKSMAYARLIGDTKALTYVLTWLAWTIGQQGYYDEAMRAYAEALDLTNKEADLTWKVELLVHSAQLNRRQGRMDVAMEYCREALHMLPQIDMQQQPFVKANIEIELGKNARDSGNWLQAQAYFQAAHGVFQIKQQHPGFNLEWAWVIYSHLAYVTYKLGNVDEAAQMASESLDAMRDLGIESYLATFLIRFAELEVQRGQPHSGLRYA